MKQVKSGVFDLRGQTGSPAPKRVREMRKASLSRPSLSSCLALSSSVHIRAQSSSLLPFLYHTPTLLSEPKVARRLHAAKTHAGNHVRRNHTVSPQSQRQTFPDKVRGPKTDPIAFVDSDYGHFPSTISHTEFQTQGHPSRPSTVTRSEQAVFERLIKDVSEPMSLELDDEDILDHDERIGAYDPNMDLNNIFENAIQQLRREKEQPAEAAARSLRFAAMAPMPRRRAIETLDLDGESELSYRKFKRPSMFADGTTLGNEVETEEERARLEVACDDHRVLVMRMLESAKSDVEVWQVLEMEIFSLITHLDENTKLEERAKKEKALHAAKVRKAETEGKDIADVKLGNTKKEASRMKLTHTKAIPINTLLSILHRNYGEYCLSALRIFRRKYPASSYALHVLATIKRRGPISYVLGVSTDLYNEVLFIQWAQYSDLHGVADMLEEMLNQGLEGNQATMALIQGIAEQRWQVRRGSFSPVLKAWWTLRGAVEGWRRVRDLFMRIKSELAEREATLVKEAESEDGEMEAGKGR